MEAGKDAHSGRALSDEATLAATLGDQPQLHMNATTVEALMGTLAVLEHCVHSPSTSPAGHPHAANSCSSLWERQPHRKENARLPDGPAVAAEALASSAGSRSSTAAPVDGAALANALSRAASACRENAGCRPPTSADSTGISTARGACEEARASRSRMPRNRCRCAFSAAPEPLQCSTASTPSVNACML